MNNNLFSVPLTYLTPTFRLIAETARREFVAHEPMQHFYSSLPAADLRANLADLSGAAWDESDQIKVVQVERLFAPGGVPARIVQVPRVLVSPVFALFALNALALMGVEEYGEDSAETEESEVSPLQQAGISPMIEAILQALPEDLTGFNLAPLFALATNKNERHAIRAHELAWQPKCVNLSDKYNGPLGESGVPHDANLLKWGNEWRQNQSLEDLERAIENNSPGMAVSMMASHLQRVVLATHTPPGEELSGFHHLDPLEIKGVIDNLKQMRLGIDVLEAEVKKTCDTLAGLAVTDADLYQSISSTIGGASQSDAGQVEPTVIIPSRIMEMDDVREEDIDWSDTVQAFQDLHDFMDKANQGAAIDYFVDDSKNAKEMLRALKIGRFALGWAAAEYNERLTEQIEMHRRLASEFEPLTIKPADFGSNETPE